MGTRIVEASELGAWSSDWDRLVLSAALPTPFSRSWWLSGVAGPGAHFVLVLEGDRLLGGLALERRRWLGVDRFEVLGGGKLCPDHLDLLADPDHVPEVIAALRDWATSPGARIFDLDGIREDAWLLDALPGVRVSTSDVAIHEVLSGTAQDYFARRSKTFLKRVRKQQRRLEASGVRCRRVSPEEVGPALDRFTELHAVREDRAELLQEMSRIRRAAEAGAAVGEVEFYVAEHEGVWGAVLMNFVVGGRLNVYQTARSFDPIFNHVGSVIDTLAIEDACSAALVEVDFLRGAEPFKRSFAASERDLLRFRSGHGVRGRMALAVLVGGTSLRSAVGRQWRRMVQKKSSGSDGSSGSLRALVGHVQSWKRPR